MSRQHLRNWKINNNYIDVLIDTIDDHLAIDELIRQYTRNNPQRGENTLYSCLITEGVKVTGQRLRDSIHRVDSEGCILRKSKAVKRRVYNINVLGPHHLWHIEGNHKLIKYNFVIHGARGVVLMAFPDLYIIFLHCSDNNRSGTVM